MNLKELWYLGLLGYDEIPEKPKRKNSPIQTSAPDREVPLGSGSHRWDGCFSAIVAVDVGYLFSTPQDSHPMQNVYQSVQIGDFLICEWMYIGGIYERPRKVDTEWARVYAINNVRSPYSHAFVRLDDLTGVTQRGISHV